MRVLPMLGQGKLQSTSCPAWRLFLKFIFAFWSSFAILSLKIITLFLSVLWFFATLVNDFSRGAFSNLQKLTCFSEDLFTACWERHALRSLFWIGWVLVMCFAFWNILTSSFKTFLTSPQFKHQTNFEA